MQTFWLHGIQMCINHLTGEVLTVAALNALELAVR